MDVMQKQVKEFHLKFGRPVETLPQLRNVALRKKLIEEECKETIDAMTAGDLVETVDGLCDLIYVCLGAALEFGVDLQPLYDEVHKTNMAKDGGHTRADGKVCKPAGWQPPRIKQLLIEQGYKDE